MNERATENTVQSTMYGTVMPKNTKPTQTVLDHIDNIVVPGAPFQEPTNEYYALVFLWRGLKFLFHQASCCDDVVRQKSNTEGKLGYSVMGNDPIFDGVPRTLLYCAFHWYAITACQYVRTVGAIASSIDPSRPLPLDYVKKVIPEVHVFRDKVAAHFAWGTRNKRDSEAERKLSIMPTLTFQDSAFFMGAMMLSVTSSGKKSNSKAIMPWSISGIHLRLRERYWPTTGEETEVGSQ